MRFETDDYKDAIASVTWQVVRVIPSNLPSNVPAPFPTLPLGGMSLAFAGLLQRNRYGSLNAVLNNSTMTQYAANSTLVNSSLNNGSSTGSGQAGTPKAASPLSPPLL